MLEAIVSGFHALLTPQALFFMLIGVLYGLVIGILPGLGGVVAMALLRSGHPSATVTQLLTPLNESAPPNLPAVLQAALERVPL